MTSMMGMSSMISMATATSMMSSSPTMTSMASSNASSEMGGMGGMGGMDMMGMMGPHSCKISMLWNWYTVDACFLSSTWHITSEGMFAGSCIGVILLTILIELLRRVQREYDQYIFRQFEEQQTRRSSTNMAGTDGGTASPNSNGDGKGGVQLFVNARGLGTPSAGRSFRPSLLQQLVRATVHMLQFAIAYLLMLLAMYYNGYLIICIFIGAWLGFFIFSWEMADAGAADATGCCG